MIFLDNASTTRVFDEVVQVMNLMLTEQYYNPSALYGHALEVKKVVEQARVVIANRLHASAEEIYFTSCATESNNLALIKGFKNKKGNLVISSGEHASCNETAKHLKSMGLDVRFVKLTHDGQIDEEDLLSKIDDATCLVSIIHVSNETGVVNDLENLTKLIRHKNKNVVIASDGVQALCKVDNNVNRLGVDIYTMSAHKIGGPKGCGAIYIRKGLSIAPLIIGGGQERNMRSGTENTAGIVGFAKAIEVYEKKFSHDNIVEMRDCLLKKFIEIGGEINGSLANNSAAIISASFPGIKSEILQHILSDQGILIGLGSACSSKLRQNHVLAAMGRDKKHIDGSVRISFGVFNTMDEIERASKIITNHICELRRKINA